VSVIDATTAIGRLVEDFKVPFPSGALGDGVGTAASSRRRPTVNARWYDNA